MYLKYILLQTTLVYLSIKLNYIHCENILSVNLHENVKFITSEKFLSAALGIPSIAQQFRQFNMSNEKLLTLCKHLSIGYLRIGGNMADRLTFSLNSTETEIINLKSVLLNDDDTFIGENLDEVYVEDRNYTLSGEQWIKINKFADNIGAKILFDLNSLQRNEDGSWNFDNTKELLTFSDNHGFDVDWQLGNEPELYKNIFNTTVNATQLAKDYFVLRTILNEYPRYRNSLLVGPETTRPKIETSPSAKYFKEFLENLNSSDVIQAATMHHYYLDGQIATLDDFLNITTFNLLEYQLGIIKNIMRNLSYDDTSLWLSETSSAFGGGAANLSNTYAGTFLWLDKLGLAAKLGVKVVIRQSLFRNHYALIDNNYDPYPDWWLSILYKKLVGRKVLNYNMTISESLRLYCQCAPLDYNKDVSAITVFGINISNSTKLVKIKGIEQSEDAYIYVLTGNSSLTSKDIVLNGELLKLTKNGDLPDLKGNFIDIRNPIEIQAYSLIFLTITSIDAKICSNS